MQFFKMWAKLIARLRTKASCTARNLSCRKKVEYKPHFDILEARIVPADYYWRPTIRDVVTNTFLAATPGNWTNGPGADARGYNVPPGNDDVLIFDASSNQPCVFNALAGFTFGAIEVEVGNQSRIILQESITFSGGANAAGNLLHIASVLEDAVVNGQMIRQGRFMVQSGMSFSGSSLTTQTCTLSTAAITIAQGTTWEIDGNMNCTNSPLDNNGVLTIFPWNNGAIDLHSSDFTNGNTVQFYHGSINLDHSKLWNLTWGNFRLRNTASVRNTRQDGGVDLFENQGALWKTSSLPDGQGLSIIQANFLNSGRLGITSGALQLSGATSQQVAALTGQSQTYLANNVKLLVGSGQFPRGTYYISGGILEGQGTIQGNVSMTSPNDPQPQTQRFIRPGFPALAANLDIVGNLTMSSLTTLEIGISPAGNISTLNVLRDAQGVGGQIAYKSCKVIVTRDPAATPGLGSQLTYLNYVSSLGNPNAVVFQNQPWNVRFNNELIRVSFGAVSQQGAAAGRDYAIVVRAPVQGAANFNPGNAVLLAAFQNNPNLNPNLLSIASVNGNPNLVGTAFTTPGGGSMLILANGAMFYTPAPGFLGTDTVDYVVTDGTNTVDASISVDVATDTMTVIDPSDANYDTTSPGILTRTTTATSTTTAVSASPNPAYAGQSVTFTATVSASGGSPTGWVNFYDSNGNLLGQDQVVNGVASYTTSSLPVGTDNISAVYSGDVNFSASFASASVGVSMDSTTTTVSAPATAVYSQWITLIATVAGVNNTSVDPTGEVDFYANGVEIGSDFLDGSGNATLTTNALVLGNNAVTAVYDGDSNFNGSTSDPNVTVSAADTTTDFWADPAVSGQPFNLTAVVSAVSPASGVPTGTVEITENGDLLGTGTLDDTGTAPVSISGLAAGTYTIVATYDGDGNFNGSSVSYDITINPGDSSTTLSSSVNTPVYGQALTISANVAASSPATGTPTGTGTFTADGNPLGTDSLDGSGNATVDASDLSAGSHTIVANYSGDGNFNPSSMTMTLIVAPGGTTTSVASSENPSVLGDDVVWTATVAAASPASGTPTGTAEFFANGTPLGEGALDSNGIATFDSAGLASGTSDITAIYLGDSNFLSSTGLVIQTVNPDPNTQAPSLQSTTVTATAGSSVIGQTVTLRANVAAASGTPTGSVDFFADGVFLANDSLDSNGNASTTVSSLTVGTQPIVPGEWSEMCGSAISEGTATCRSFRAVGWALAI